jgi:hypothetical protein
MAAWFLKIFSPRAPLPLPELIVKVMDQNSIFVRSLITEGHEAPVCDQIFLVIYPEQCMCISRIDDEP